MTPMETTMFVADYSLFRLSKYIKMKAIDSQIKNTESHLFFFDFPTTNILLQKKRRNVLKMHVISTHTFLRISNPRLDE